IRGRPRRSPAPTEEYRRGSSSQAPPASANSAAPSPEACLDYWKQNIPIGRVIEPEEVGELAAFLLCDRSASITGANMFADGGMTSQLVSKEPFASKTIEGR
ncbi:MAG: SDR family oxidoreductase, partial [Candidatus Latescibacteria bacterium]|nr:SDR family oxidoreductase [Candidatus Latescibacterota bacterium]